MSERPATDQTATAISNRPSNLCHICGRDHSSLVLIKHLSPDLQKILKPNDGDLESIARVCPSCVGLFKRAQEQLKNHANIFADVAHALPTPVRMDADTRFTGRGVTIAFLDSGFFAHKDLTSPTIGLSPITVFLLRTMIRRCYKHLTSQVGTA